MTGGGPRTEPVEAGAPSYWTATAGDFPPWSAYPGAGEWDTAIIGAGFTGLSAAWHLRQQGRTCAVLDARQPGWGASGRNGGMVVPRMKATFPELERRFGVDGALELYRAVHGAVNTLEAMVREAGIDCGFARSGHLTPFDRGLNQERFEADIRWLEDRAGDAAPRVLTAGEAGLRLGTDYYAGAYFEPRGGGIHPLKYCIGLARALTMRGVPVFGGSPVLSWRRSGGALKVATPGGELRCRTLILATNGYSDMAGAGRRLKRRIVPVVSSIVATGPLPRDVLQTILPGGELATDAKRLTNYYRTTPDGRLLFGGRGGAGAGSPARVYDRLMRDAAAIYPQLGDARAQYRWSGRVAVTLDGLPRIGTLEPGVHYAMGYNGRGVAFATYLGRMLAEAACGGPMKPVALASLPFPRIPFHSLRMPAKQAVMLFYGLLDRLRP